MSELALSLGGLGQPVDPSSVGAFFALHVIVTQAGQVIRARPGDRDVQAGGGRHGDAGRRRDGVVEQGGESLRPLKYAESAEWIISALF